MKISHLFFPDKCPFCGKMLAHQKGMCEECKHSGILRKNAFQEDISFLPSLLNLYCPLQYFGSVKDCMVRYKFQGENWLATPLAEILHDTIIQQDGYQYCNLITSVPVSDKRYTVRGYNQSALIARKLSDLSGIPYQETMVRMRQKGDVQTGKMNRMERYQTKRFALINDVQVYGGILLIDDILTTGSTLNECTTLLLNAGADFVKAGILASGRRDLGGVCA